MLGTTPSTPSRAPSPVATPTVPARRRTHGSWWLLPLLAVTLLIAAPLRLIWLDSYPPGLFYDPAGEGIDAQRILAGARPVFLPANNGREPLLNYLMAGVFAVTGPTIGGLRLTVALIGLASVPVTFLWARAFFGPRVALLAAALMAVSTWHVFLSRFGVRAVLLPLLEPLALLLIWRAMRSGRLLTWVAAGVVLGLSVYTYLPIRVFPVVVLVVLVAGLLRRRRGALTPALSQGEREQTLAHAGVRIGDRSRARPASPRRASRRDPAPGARRRGRPPSAPRASPALPAREPHPRHTPAARS